MIYNMWWLQIKMCIMIASFYLLNCGKVNLYFFLTNPHVYMHFILYPACSYYYCLHVTDRAKGHSWRNNVTLQQLKVFKITKGCLDLKFHECVFVILHKNVSNKILIILPSGCEKFVIWHHLIWTRLKHQQGQ